MIRNNFRPTSMLLALLSIFSLSQQAFAELYISPVVKGSVIYHDSGSGNNSTLSGESAVHGEFLMKEKAENFSAVMQFGQNVPLFVAIERVVPNSIDWKINLDDGLENSVVNWEGGESWEDVLATIAQQNNLFIKINNGDRSIGISRDSSLATHLAVRVPEVWRLTTDKSLRENLNLWAQRAGWRLEWSPRLNVDYPITHGAILTGKFVDENGVVGQLLNSLKDVDRPLMAVFHTSNNVLEIKEAGFKQEVMF